MNENSKEKPERQILNYFGIGAFFILSLFEFTNFFGDILKDILIINDFSPKTNYILSVISSLILFTVLLVLLLKNIKSYAGKSSRKLLFIAIFSLLLIWILEFCYDQYISDYLKSEYTENYNGYSEFWKDKYLLLGILAGVPVLYYIILGIVVLNKKL